MICPFAIIFGEKVECIYLDDVSEPGECNDIMECPLYADAWCTRQIKKSLKDEE